MQSRRAILKYAAFAPLPLGLTSGSWERHADAATRYSGDHVSVLKFINQAYHSPILEGTSSRDISDQLQSAIDSGENLFFPGSGEARYVIDGALRLTTNYQRLFSDGFVRLDFRGSDASANAIELLSTRRDSGDDSAFRRAQHLSGFRLTGPPSASYGSMIFLEEGTFFPSIQRIYSDAGVNHGFLGRLADAFLRINGNERSYVNDVTIRDCVFCGIRSGGRDGNFPPVGIWVEGAVEGRAENTKLFYFDECMRLGDPVGRTRNVQHMVFDQVQLEPTKPGQVVDNQASLNIYSASACSFRDCRFTPGNGRGSANSVAVRISPGGFGARQVRFRDCSFQGMRNARTVCRILPGAAAEDVVFSGGDVRGFTGEPVQDESGRAQISFANGTFFDR